MRRPSGAHLDRQFGREDASLGERRQKRGSQDQAIGRSRGGRTTKIHAVLDEEGRPRDLLLTGGNNGWADLASPHTSDLIWEIQQCLIVLLRFLLRAKLLILR
jgi:hypothetical protein